MNSAEVEQDPVDRTPVPGAKNRFAFTAKPGIVGPVSLLLIISLYYWKLLFTRQFTLLATNEGVNQAWAWFNFQLRTLRHGGWPLWNPFSFSGHVFSGETQTGAFYPLYFLLALIPFNRHDLFSPELYQTMYPVVHFLAAWFMFCLARALGVTTLAAVAAGSVFSLGGVLGSLSEWPHLLNSGIWLPLIFLTILKALDSPTLSRAATYAAFSGFFLGLSALAGGIHFTIMQAIVIVTAAAFHGFRNRIWKQTIAVVGTATVTAFCTGAAQLLPSAEYSHLAIRFISGGAVPASERIPYHYLTDSLFAHGLSAFLMPTANAGVDGGGEIVRYYMGVFTLLLAVIAVVTRWDRPWVRYLTGLGGGAFCFSLGQASLLHGLLYAFVPYLSVAREADRFLYLADFAIAVLAAWGFDALFFSRDIDWRPINKILRWIAIAAIAPLAWSAVYAQPPMSPWISLSLVLIFVSWLLFRYAALRNGRTVAAVLAIAMILFDVNAFDWSIQDPLSSSFQPNQLERLLSTENMATFLRSQPGLYRSEFLVDQPPSMGDAFQVQTTSGGAATLLTDYGDLRAHPELLNVRYFIRPATAPDPAPVYHDRFWKVYENPTAFPRAWLVHRTIVQPDRKALLQKLGDPAIDLHRVALLDAPLPAQLAAPGSDTQDSVSIREYTANHIRVRTRTTAGGLLVLSEMAYPGWTATVNGQPANIARADGLLRGIAVPAGTSDLVLNYRPLSIYAGTALSGLAFLAIGCLFIRFRRARYNQ